MLPNPHRKSNSVCKKVGENCFLKCLALQYGCELEESVNTGKKILLLFLMLATLLVGLSAQELDTLLLADVPIVYGEADLRQRIVERTKTERPSLALVLSGGSARAFAHIGVLQYLEEQGIIPDLIISNSMGSIVGLLYAAGLSPDQILEAVSNVSLQSLFDLTLPLEGGLLESSRFLSHVASLLGPDLQLETLPIPIIVITEDMVTKRQVHICSGDFYTVMQASYALPVYFPPVEYKGHLLLDGGITNLVPAKLAYEYADEVIVSSTFYDIDTLNLKNALTILNVSIDLGKRRNGVHELKGVLDDAIWIRNAVEDVSFMEFSKVEELAKKGYASAKQQEEKIAALVKTKDSFALDGHRAQLDSQYADSFARYQLFSHVPLHVPSHVLGFGLDSEFHDKDSTLLQDDVTFGLKYQWRTGDFALSVNGGLSLQLMSNDQFSVAPALRTELQYHFLRYFRAKAHASCIYDMSKNAPILTLGSDLEGRMYVMDEKMRLSLRQSYEQLNNFKDSDHLSFWDGHSYVLSTEAKMLLSLPEGGAWNLNDSSFSLFYQNLGDFTDQRSFLGFRVETEGVYRPYNVFAGFKSFSRFALDGQGAVPFFLSDGFRTTNSGIKSQGHDFDAVGPNPANHLVGMSFSLGYRMPFNPTMAELLIFSNTSAAIYTDLLFYEQTFKPALSLGVELHSDLSLLGIRTLPLTVSVGWDQSLNTVVWGFVFNLLF